MDEAVCSCPQLTEGDVVRLRRLEEGMCLLADISRADLLLSCKKSEEEAVIIAQAQPRSVTPIYEAICGQAIQRSTRPDLFKVLDTGKPAHASQRIIADGAPIFQEVCPVFADHRVLAALSIEKTLIEQERHRRRMPAFQKALRQLQEMVIEDGLEGAGGLSPFGEHDGILVIDVERRILYASGIANNLYRRLGYMESLVGKDLKDLGTADHILVERAFNERRCLEEEAQERGRVWIRKAIPLVSRGEGLVSHLPGWKASPQLIGAILTIHDATLARRREQEARIRSAMVQEVHHRIKNNLQTIAALLRMQARRATSEEARKVLSDSISRILSVAVVHEFFSQHESRVINLREISKRVVDQFQQGIMDPEKEIELVVKGPNIYLPSQQATACALVINELLQNALEHGYPQRKEGTITVQLCDEADQVIIQIADDGRGLPERFDLEMDSSLGLKIVRILAEEDLKGDFQLSSDGGVHAMVTFPKLSLGGERDWEELE